jgi:3-oxoacyl-[acyl-carrier protein] reductase
MTPALRFRGIGESVSPTRIGEMPIDDWDKVIGVTLRGVFLCMRAVLQVMLKQKRGSIINISSIGAFGRAVLEVTPASYGASKARGNQSYKVCRC